MSAEVVFKIDNWTPKTLPMVRLGQYLLELAALYGESSNVHFKALRKGSAAVVSTVEETAIPKVAERIARARRFDAPEDVGATYDRIDRMLALDNAKATLRVEWAERTIIQFPGRDREQPIDYGAVRQEGFVDGELVRIGGRDKSVHLQLQDGDILHTNLTTDRELAKQLAPHIYTSTLRLWGTGTWRRGENEIWAIESFKVVRFDVLDDREDLSSIVTRLQRIPGSHWHEDEDPIATLIASRRDEERGR